MISENYDTLVIGAAKPWEVKRYLAMRNDRGDGCRIFTVKQYEDYFREYAVQPSGMGSAFEVTRNFKVIQPLFRRYEKIVVVTVFPYAVVHHLICLFAWLAARSDASVFVRGTVTSVNPLGNLFWLFLAVAGVLTAPLWMLLPLCVLIVRRLLALWSSS